MIYGIKTLPRLTQGVAWLCNMFNSNTGLWHLLAWVLPHTSVPAVCRPALRCTLAQFVHAARWWCRSGNWFNWKTAQHIFFFKLDQNGTQTAVPSQRMVYYTLWHEDRNKKREVGVVMSNCTLWLSGCRCTNILYNANRNWNGLHTPIVTTAPGTVCAQSSPLPSNS